MMGAPTATKQVIVVGAGGFGRELLALMYNCIQVDFIFKGFLDRDRNALTGHDVIGPVIGDPEVYIPEKADRFLLAIGDMRSRRRTVESLVSRGAQFLSLIHPTALVAATARIGTGAIIYPYTVISNGAKIDDYVHLSLFASVGHDAQVGKYCLLAPYATINGSAVLEDEVYMSTHSTVVPEKRVGRNSTISANSPVLQNVPPGSFVHGVASKVTKKLRWGDEPRRVTDDN